jgi:hypothetical protein
LHNADRMTGSQSGGRLQTCLNNQARTLQTSENNNKIKTLVDVGNHPPHKSCGLQIVILHEVCHSLAKAAGKCERRDQSWPNSWPNTMVTDADKSIRLSEKALNTDMIDIPRNFLEGPSITLLHIWRHNKPKTPLRISRQPTPALRPKDLLFNSQRGFFPWLKGPGHDPAHSSSSTAEEMEEQIKASTFCHQSDDYCCHAVSQFWGQCFNLGTGPIYAFFPDNSYPVPFFPRNISLSDKLLDQFRSIWTRTTKWAFSIP